VTSVTILNTVGSIEIYALFGCFGLTNVTIPGSVTNIGLLAFPGCPLTSVSISDSVTYLGADAFRLCSSLTNVTIGQQRPFHRGLHVSWL